MAREMVVVCYFGERIKARELCDMAGVRFKTFVKRWNLLGRPDNITLLGKLLSPYSQYQGKTTITVVRATYEEEYSIQRAASWFGISANTVRNKIALYGTRLTLDQLRVDGQRKVAGSKPRTVDMPKPQVTQPTGGQGEDSKPIGWAERKYFPDTGKSGFSKTPADNFSGTNSAGFSVYTGVGR